MSYDHYVAMCHSLQYATLTSWSFCLRIVLGSWLLRAADGLMQAAASLSFLFCNRHEINHFFCEATTLVWLAFSDSSALEYAMYICCVLMLLIPLSLILTSYSLILTAVLHMCSAEAHKKVFVTCSSHLAMVGLYYCNAIFTYMRPISYRLVNHDKVMSAFYAIFTPMLNPVIYRMRNSDVKGALTKCLTQCCLHSALRMC
ncbi:Olfactory receptor 2T8 [Heterocephalus glaber]|uniref:Olfactory receptor 2T8 n=1 Tax=Heterocephalus glaber TaxID=10181 RepID=G5BRH6_HETGA|nr:Olfactory receptor 2T8 [Heterocephalus glaber]